MERKILRKEFVNDYGVYITIWEGKSREIFALSTIGSDLDHFVQLPSNTTQAALEGLTMNKVLTLAS
jgi:hypothetical protein